MHFDLKTYSKVNGVYQWDTPEEKKSTAQTQQTQSQQNQNQNQTQKHKKREDVDAVSGER